MHNRGQRDGSNRTYAPPVSDFERAVGPSKSQLSDLRSYDKGYEEGYGKRNGPESGSSGSGSSK